MGYRAKRFADVVRAARLARRFVAHDSWSREDIHNHQQTELEKLKRHAAANSAFWRDRLAGGEIPVLEKRTLMENFDAAVTDPRLRLERLDAHLAALGDRDELLDGEFRVMATSGTTGMRGVFAYSRSEWVTRVATALRAQAFIGLTPLYRRRIAMLVATSAMHISSRFSLSTDVGLHKYCRIDVRTRPSDMLAALNEFQPRELAAYPSIAAQLAEERVAGRLDISPTTILTSSEVLTEGMEAAIREAWPDAVLQDFYSTTETGMAAAACEHENGMHLFEDMLIIENVDEHGATVPEGEAGAALLVTDLCSFAQPKLRYAISDAVVLTSEACPCGRPFRRITSIVGRSDDILELPATGGGTTLVHPLALRSAMASQARVLQYQVVHERDGLHVSLVGRAGAPETLIEDVRNSLQEALAVAGADETVHVRQVAELARETGHGAKIKVVRSALT